MTELEYINCQDLARVRLLTHVVSALDGDGIVPGSPIREEDRQAVLRQIGVWRRALEEVIGTQTLVARE